MSSLLSLKPSPTFNAAVPIKPPGSNPVLVTFEFRHRMQEEFEKLMGTNQPANESPAFPSDLDFVLELVVGWELEDPFNRENVGLLLSNYMGAATAIATTYVAEMTGTAKR